MESRLRIVIHGNVQGVFFRANTEEEARKLGLKGWVRNRSGGSVEVMAEGDKKALQKLLKWCSHGPAGASVDKVEKEWLGATGEFPDFRITYD